MNANLSAAKKNPNIIGIVAGALLFISAFLPYVSVTIFEEPLKYTLLDSKGVLFIIMGILAIVLSLLGKDMGVLIVGVIACILAVVEIADVSDLAELGETQKSIGFYVMIIASIATVAARPVWKIIAKKTNA
jgi:uncharacterized membrane protein